MEISENEFTGPTIVVAVTRCWNPRRKSPSLEDCARGYWTFKGAQLDRANRCEILMATCRSEIVGVWKIDKSVGWHNSHEYQIPSRPVEGNGNAYSCVLKPADEAFSGKYMHRKLDRNARLHFPYKFFRV